MSMIMLVVCGFTCLLKDYGFRMGWPHYGTNPPVLSSWKKLIEKLWGCPPPRAPV